MKNLTPTEIVALMDKEVSGQDDAKRMLAIALRNRWRIQQLPPELRRGVKKQNVLLAGPTGSGKTALMRVIRDILGMPVLEIDITGYSETGYQGEEVTDIPKGFGRLDFEVPAWFSGEEKKKVQEEVRPPSKDGAWAFEYGKDDTIILTGNRVNGTPAEVHTYFLRAFLLGLLVLDQINVYQVEDEILEVLLPKTIHDFANNPTAENASFDYLVAGLYVMSRNPAVLIADDTEFTDFYKACDRAENMRYDKPFTLGTYEGHVSHLFTNTIAELKTPAGWIPVVSGWKTLGFDDIDTLVDLPICRSTTVKEPTAAEAARIKEIAIAYLIRGVFVGMLKDGKLDLPTFVTQRVNTIMIGEERYGFYFEKAASGNFPDHATEVRRLSEIGYNIMSAKPNASVYGFKMWRKNIQTLPLNTKKLCAGPNDRICNTYPFFNQFKTSDEFTTYALKCMGEVSPVRIAEIFTDQQNLDYKPFRIDIDSILQNNMQNMDDIFRSGGIGSRAIYGTRGHRGGGNVRDNFINTYGVVFIDEIDKLIGEQGRKSDVSREGVQRSLLKVVEGGEYAGYDTTNILFVAAGAFSGKHPSMLMPELLGRFPLRATLKKLLKEDIESIAQLPNSEFMGAVKLIEIEGVKVIYDEDTFKFIADTVVEINDVEDTGARRIGAVVEHIFSDAYFKPETYLESGYDVTGAACREKPPMEAITAARMVKEARAKIEAAAEAEREPVPETKGNK